MKAPVVALVAVVATVSAAVPAWSQDTSELDALLGETVSSTASKSAQASTSVPALAVNVTAEDLRRYGIRTLAEAYNFLALGIVAEDTLGDPEVGTRGMLFTYDAGKHILLLIDGHVTNDQRNGASYHGEAAGIPIELIDHIEIMLGPGSVLYGANATLGVVNVVTKQARDFRGVHLIAEAALSPPENKAHQPVAQLDAVTLRGLGRAYRVGIGLGRTFRLFGQSAELTGQIEYYALTGPKMGWSQIGAGNNYGPYVQQPGIWGGDTERSYYQQLPSGYLRIARGDLQLTLHALTGRTSRPYSRAQEFLRDFDDPQSYVDRSYGAADLSWHHYLTGRVSLFARVYGDASSEYSQIRGSTFLGCLGSQPNGCIHTSQGHARWAGSEIQATVKWLSDFSMSSMLGLEGRIRQVGFESGIRDLPTGAPVAAFGQYNTNGQTGAVYAQQVYNPVAAVTVNAGARWDFDDQLGQRISPRGAVSVDTWHGATAKAIYSEAFRAPTIEELHLTNRYLALAAPTLSPEIVRSAEASLQQRVGTQRMLVGVFRSWWDNVVLSEILTQAELSAAQRAGQIDSSAVTVFQFRNVARVDNYGVNTSYEGTSVAGRLSYGANLTAAYTRLRTATDTKLITVTPLIFGNVRLSYDFGDGRPVVGIASQISGKRLNDHAEDPGVIGLQYAPPMIDVRVTACGRVPRLASLHYRVSADYSFATSSPFSVVAGGMNGGSELIPVNRATALFTLEYQF
jgi:outer membrane cobalamin receptor